MSTQFVDGEERWIPAVREFFKRCYSSTYRLAVDEVLLRWQFGGMGPSPGRYHLKLAVQGSAVHACLGYVPVELSVVGRAFRGAWTANWMVDPEQRRLGLGPLLLKQLMTEFDAVLSVGLERDSVDLLPRMGWVDFGDLFRHVRVLDRTGAARLTGSAAPLAAAASGHPAVPAPLPQPGPGRPLDGEAADVWDRVWGTHGAGTRRTPTFLAWRYTHHPTFDYRVLVTRSSSGVASGFAVYRVEPVRDLPVLVGRIVEIAAVPEAASDLVAKIVDHAQAENVAVLDFFCSSHRFDGALVDAGFLPGNHPEVSAVPLLFQPVNRQRTGIRFMGYLAKLPAGAATQDWYVTKGDGDQDRPN